MLSIILVIIDILIILFLVILAIGPKRFFYRLRHFRLFGFTGTKAI